MGHEVDPRVRALLSALPDPLGVLESLFTHSPVPYAVFDRQGRCALTNLAYRELFGRAPPEDYCLFRDEEVSRTGLDALVERAFAGETVKTATIWYDPKRLAHVRVDDARRVAISLTLFPLGGEADVTHVGIAYRDVTAEQSAIEALGSAERRLLAVTDNATLGLVMMDARGHCVFMNPAAERIFGLSLAQVQGGPLHDFVHHTRPDGTPYPMAECPIDRALPTRAQEGGEDVFVRPDGTFYPVAFTASPIVVDGAAVGTVIELRETSEDKRREREREELLAELKEAVALRDEFLAIASHELKTPLTPVQLRLNNLAQRLARGEPVAETLPRDVDALQRQVRRLSHLVEELLDVSRLSSGQLSLQLEWVPLDVLLREVVSRFEAEAERSGCALRLGSVPEVVGRWDRLRLEQVVTNLLSNAIKYGAAQPVRVEAEVEGGHARIRVVDSGIGISAEAMPRIFEKFGRGVSGRHYGGLGLGLYVTKQIVEALGGRVTARNAEGRGTVLEVELPLAQSAS